MVDNINCPVCQDIFEKPKLLHCGHTFCCKCIDVSLESSRRTNEVKCPLCRKVTMCPKNNGDGLMDNYFVSDHQYLTRIATCAECSNITRNLECEICLQNLCENCMFLHMQSKCGRMSNLAQCDELRDDEEEKFEDVNLEAEFISDLVQTKFYFELDGKVIIPPEFSGERHGNLNINLSIMHCLHGDKLMVAPNGGSFGLIYNDKGEELLRQELGINVIDITNGINNYPILIQNGENAVYEYAYGTLEKIFSTQLHVPRAISCLSNGRLVTVGRKLRHSLNGFQETSGSTLCIFEHHGQLVKEILILNEEKVMAYPTSICVDMKMNNIFVGVAKKKQILHFREDGSYVSSYSKPDISGIDLGDVVTSTAVNNSTLFPLSLAYSQVHDLLFASFHSTLGSGIYMLSPDLTMLGLLYSIHDVGIPAGLSCDEDGRLYVGGGTDGIIRIFRLSQFKNKF